MALFPTGRTRVDVGPADVGRRVSVRYRTSAFGSEAELVGILFRWSGGLTDGMLRVRTRNGSEIGIRVRDIIAMRVVPPELSAYAMLRLAQEGWPTMESEQLGTWMLRAARGATSRCNSVRVSGPEPRNLDSRLSKVNDWYRERSLVPKLQLTTPSGLDDALDDLGWTDSRWSRLMVAAIPLLLEKTAGTNLRDDLDITLHDEADSEWLEGIADYDADVAAEYTTALGTGRPATYLSCRDADGQLLGIGHCVLLGKWCYATTIRTLPQARRVGIATAVTGRLAAWAADVGARNWFLQFYEDNTAALSFYERLGLTTHHRYEYRSPGESDLSSDAAL